MNGSRRRPSPGDGAGYGGGRSGGSTSRTRAPFSCCSAGSEYRLGLGRAGVETTWMRLVIGRIAASLPAGTGWRAYRGSSDLARRNDEPTQTLAIDVPGLSNVGFRIFHHPNDLYLVGRQDSAPHAIDRKWEQELRSSQAVSARRGGTVGRPDLRPCAEGDKAVSNRCARGRLASKGTSAKPERLGIGRRPRCCSRDSEHRGKI